MTDSYDTYLVGFFDVLGFKQRLKDNELREMARRYDALVG